MKQYNLISKKLIRLKFPPGGDKEADGSSVSPSPFALRFETSPSLSLHGGNLTLVDLFDTKFQ